MNALNGTHDPRLRSWVESANRPQADFPIQNLPFAVFRHRGSGETFRCGVGIGDQVLDLRALHELQVVQEEAAAAVAAGTTPDLSALMELGAGAWSALRAAVSELLRAGSSSADIVVNALVPARSAEFSLPARIGNYTDFYTSIHHATAVGRLFRPDRPLLPNYQWVPIAYHGRASSIRVSGQEIRRPLGQVMAPGADTPELRASARVDHELELAALIGSGNALGRPIPLAESERHIFGICLLNDWSARDLQAWEYQPLGPFLSKSFATTISPWIVPLEALAPFRVPWTRSPADPQPLQYLDGEALRRAGALDIHLEAFIESARMREKGLPRQRLSRSNFRDAYWTLGQMIAHHTVNGCNLEPGDLLGTGTQSGPAPQEAGSMLELTRGGRQTLELSSGERRGFLEDGDRITFTAWCERPSHARIGFGEVTGTIVPAHVAREGKPVS